MRIWSLLLVLLSYEAFGAIKLSESVLKDYAAKESPSLDQIQAAFLSSELRYRESEEDLAPELFGRAGYMETNEKPIIPFIPVFSPVKDAELGIRKRLSHGVGLSAAAVTRQQSAVGAGGKYRNVTSSSLHLTANVDLWRNFLGRVTEARMQNAEDERRRAELEKEIRTKAFHVSLRKLYWGLVANNESTKISQALLKTSETQERETERRLRNNVAEKDELARYRAQVASRMSSLAGLEYQRQNYLRQLKTLLPDLASQDIILGDYDVEKTIKEVMACTAVIAQSKGVPYDNTLYDETVNLLRGKMKNDRTINERYADPDVSLYGKVKSVGVSSDSTPVGFRGNYNDSWNDMTATNRTGYEVGLNVTVPLGDARAATQRTKELYDEKRLRALIGNTEANMATVHQDILNTIVTLNQVIEYQRVNTEQLHRRLEHVRRKYEQARASVNDLIDDQDELLSSQLMTVDTRLAVVTVVLDYLAIYTETPCDFNRIQP